MTSTERQGSLPFSGVLAILRTTLMCCADKTFGAIFLDATGRVNPGCIDDRTMAIGLEVMISKYAGRDLSSTRIRSHRDVDIIIGAIERIWPLEVRDEICLGKVLADLVGKSGLHLFYNVSDTLILELVGAQTESADNELVAS